MLDVKYAGRDDTHLLSLYLLKLFEITKMLDWARCPLIYDESLKVQASTYSEN